MKKYIVYGLGLLCLVGFPLALHLAFFEAPLQTGGQTPLYWNQKIFYFHVPSAFVTFIAVFVCGIWSMLYLRSRDPRHDTVARSAAECAIAFGLVMFVVDADTPGIKTGRKEDKMGQRASNTTDVIFEDVKIPKSALVGSEEGGFKVAMPDERPDITAVAWRREPTSFGDVRDELQDELRLIIRGETVSAYGTFCSGAKPLQAFARLYGTAGFAHIDYNARTATVQPARQLPSALGRLAESALHAVEHAKASARNMLTRRRSRCSKT